MQPDARPESSARAGRTSRDAAGRTSSDAAGGLSSDAWLLAALALGAGLFLGFGLDRYGVVNADEAIYHGIAEHMAATGDLLHLDFRGEPRVYDAFLNAPLHYWIRAGGIALFGSHGFTMRGLSAAGGVLTVLATFALARQLAGRRAALLAALVQLTTFQFVYLHGARTGELDALVAALLTGAVWWFVRALREGRSFLPHHLLLVALFWTKAPLVAVPAAVELGWLLARREARPHLRRWLGAGLLLLPLALSWHALQAVLHPERVLEVLGAMAGQASGARADSAVVGPAGNLRFYAGVLLYGAFPWSAAHPFAVLHALHADGQRALRMLLLAFVAAVLVFFTLVSKHYAWYVMPAYPFLSVLMGVWLADLTRRAAPAWTGWGAGAVLGALLWLDVDALTTNPFAARALTFPMQTHAREVLGVGPAFGIPLLAAGWLALWLVAGRSPRTLPLRRALGGAVAGLLLALASVRALAPLAHLDTRRPIEDVRDALRRAQEEGRALAYPIALGQPEIQITRFHFGEDFEIVHRALGPQPGLYLYERGDPRVLGRSIGREGLEHRLRRGEARATPDPSAEGPRPRSQSRR